MKKNYKIKTLLFALSILGTIRLKAQENSIIVNSDTVVNVAFGSVNKADLLGGVSTVNVTNLLKKSYGTYSLDNLQCLVSGYAGTIWGQAPLILVDGIPRSAADIRLVEVESITVLKGASNVVLYGSSAAKGVVLITTKRGSNSPLHIDVRVNTGAYVPKRYPGYLHAADYMTLYNEASRNDGIAEKYSQDLIQQTAQGTNPYKYPDVNYFSSDYLRKAYSKSDITTEISGGNDRARYYTNVGFSYNNDILNYGSTKKNNSMLFNIRSNVDMNLTKWLSASTDAVAIVSDNYAGRGDFWGTSATFRPNWFSPLVPISMFDPNNKSLQTIVDNSNNVIDGKYLLGGTSTDQTNAFADMLAAGYVKTKNRRFMFNVNANADLGSLLKGLSFKTGLSMDYSSIYSEGYQVAYAVYQPTWATVNNSDVITALKQYNNDGSSTNEFIGQTGYNQTMSFKGQFDYKRSFKQVHNVSASLLGWGYMTQVSSDAGHSGSKYQPVRNSNLGLQAGYNFAHRYYIDFSGALTHSAKLAPGHRDGISPTATIGWRISDEKFFKNNVSFVDELKINASYASVKQDIDITNNTTDYYLYQGYFNNKGGWYQWRDGVAGGWTTGSVQGENLDLSFIKRNEFRVGLDASLFNHFIILNSNYFIQHTDGLLTQGASTIFPSYFSNWDFSFLPYLNYNNDKRSGIDYSINIQKKVGAFQLSAGFCGMNFTSKAVRRDEVYQDAYQRRAGQPLDAYWGYVSEGFFQNQADIDNHANQTFGSVKPGDIKYKDINNDGVIDTKDQVNLGHNGWAVSPFTYGVNVTVNWKGFTLFAMGSGQSGAIGFKNSSYYWVSGSAKYSDVVLGRWTEDTKDKATYPRLTTTSSSNNFQNSTFWSYKNNRFNLARVQLTYDFNERLFKKSFVHGLSVYANGDNLLVVSKERKMMETNIGSAPQYRFYNIGLKASF
jgi:TonB-linked SusC/RagA family outer membrane protein